MHPGLDEPSPVRGRVLVLTGKILASSAVDCQRGGGRDHGGQATKGVWGMSRRQQAMKGVEDCDKPGGAVNRALSPGYPNGRILNP